MSVTRTSQESSSSSASTSSQATPSASAGSAGASASAVQLKQALRGKAYADQAGMLAPTVSGARDGAAKKATAPGFVVPGGALSMGDGDKKEASAPAPSTTDSKGDDEGDFGGGLDLFSDGPNEPARFPIVPELTTSHTIAQGGGVENGLWGNTSYDVKVGQVSAAESAGQMKVKANLHTDLTWQVGGEGAIDVPDAASGVITADNAQAIHDDLMPRREPPRVSPRKVYWNKALVVRHEKYHATDFAGHVAGAGVRGAAEAIEGVKVTSPEEAIGRVKSAARRMSDDIQTYYFGSEADPGHDARARELPAYQDGEASYKTLAEGVLKKGTDLREAAQKQPREAPRDPAPEASQKKGENDG